MSYTAVLALIASIVSVGYQSPVEQHVASRGLSVAALETTSPSVDQIVAADLAASTALIANLSVATNASNFSISLNAKSDLSQTNDSILSKPQISQANDECRGIVDYVTVTGDTVPSVAGRFGVSGQTIRWANRLTTDAVNPGTQLAIPCVDGVVYTAAAGDSLDSIASKYGVDQQRLITYNDLEVSGVIAGQRLVLPGGVLPNAERPETIAATSPSAAVTSQVVANAASVGNRYDYGYCTWYVYNRRAQLGRPVGSFWGNAVSWARYAAASGYVVNNTPAVGAVMQNGGGYGHVAVVESIDEAGNVTVSEMNYEGWNRISWRTLSAGQAAGYNFIH